MASLRRCRRMRTERAVHIWQRTDRQFLLLLLLLLSSYVHNRLVGGGLWLLRHIRMMWGEVVWQVVVLLRKPGNLLIGSIRQEFGHPLLTSIVGEIRVHGVHVDGWVASRSKDFYRVW